MQYISKVSRILIFVGVLGILLFSTGSILQPFSSSEKNSSPVINTLNEVNDSAFQSIVDSLGFWISKEEYYRWQQGIIKRQIDSLGSLSPQNLQEVAYQNLDTIYHSLEGELSEAEQSRSYWDGKLDQYLSQPIYQEARRFQFRGGWYRIFLASSNLHTIQLHTNRSGKLQPLSTTWEQLNRKKTIPVCITNGGMYHPDGAPVGLLVENGQVVHPINQDSLPVADNFHLYPNGIFHTDTAGRFHVSTSEAFNRQVAASSYKTISQATQSGPMLVIDGKIHPRFTYGSPNTNIRNGVGILRASNGNTAVFVISETRINLYDFALLFQKLLRCDQALYLDGVISKMYYQNNEQIMGDLGGSLGPVISVVRKIE